MNKFNRKLLLISLILVSQIAFAKDTKVSIRKMELINHCNEILVNLSVHGRDTLTVSGIQFAVDGKPVDITLSDSQRTPLFRGGSNKVTGQIKSKGNTFAWQPAYVEISYTVGASNAKAYYSTRKLKYKKPIEDRKSYLSFSEGGMKFIGHNKTGYAGALSKAPVAILADIEFGRKISSKTFFTITNSVQELTPSSRLNSLLLGCKYEKCIGKIVLFGQAQAGLCSSTLFYKPLEASQDFDNEHYRNIGTSFIYGAQIGIGYTLSKSTRLYLKSNLVHTNLTVNKIPQSITGVGINGGINFYFNNRKN